MAETQFVVFRLGKEKYGIDILNVAGITEFDKFSKVPTAPSFVEGVMNLRGDVIPVINLKKKFNIEASVAEEDDARVILINVKNSTIGFLVDDANQVVKINDEDIEDTPQILKSDDRKFLKGVGKREGELYILLDMDNILSDMEQQEVVSIGNPTEENSLEL